jgi:hypothetical protein
MRRRSALPLLAALMVTLSASTASAQLFVNASVAGGDQSGTSWTNAMPSLQDAIAEAVGAGVTELWVAAGTYRPDDGMAQIPGNRSAIFELQNELSIYGGFIGTEVFLDQRDFVANVTILSGDLSDNDVGDLFHDSRLDNSYHVITGTDTDATAVLDGVTIKSGFANEGGSDNGTGGAMYNEGGDATLRNCIFTENSAVGRGGAIMNEFGASPTLEDCTITGNAAGGDGGGIFNDTSTMTATRVTFTSNTSDSNGGGTYNDFGTVTFTSCTWRLNTATGVGGGIAAANFSNGAIRRCTFDRNQAGDGGGLYQTECQPLVVRTLFLDNHAIGDGGAIYNSGGADASYVNVRILGNTSGDDGAGVTNVSCSPTFTNMVIAGNTAEGSGGFAVGGAVFNSGASPSLYNCTMAFNNAEDLAGGIFNESGSNPLIYNAILWGNLDPSGSTESAQIFSSLSTPTIEYSIVEGLTGSLGGAGNVDDDPMFGDAAGADGSFGTEDDDYSLSPGSPAIDAGNTPILPNDAADLDGDGSTAERVSQDLAGSQRTYDDLATFDSGIPGSPTVDMGGYEFSDCNHNDTPDEDDIIAGTSLDCDGNGIPDECDIHHCGAADVDCQDCNLNGSQDACDIASATSLDSDLDGVPDECTHFIGGCGAVKDWSCEANWALGGLVYPDNDGSTRYSVILDLFDSVLLDLPITIDTLWIKDNFSTLRITQTPGVDLTLAEPGGLLCEGRIEGSGDSRILLTGGGPCTFQSGGKFIRNPFGATPANNALHCGETVLFQNGEITLSDTMSLEVNGDLRLDGTETCPLCGGKLPPILQNPGSGNIQVSHDLVLNGDVDIHLGPNGSLNLGGDMINHMVIAEQHDLAHATVRLDGAKDQLYEVGGRDFGATLDGFNPPGKYHSNYSVGRLEVAAHPSRIVRFRNDVANASTRGPCGEALYVHELVIEPGSTISIEDTIVYYEVLNVPVGTILTQGCGDLIQIPACTTNESCMDHDVCIHDACGPPCVFTPVAYGDVNASGAVDLDDVLCGLAGFAEFAECPNADLTASGPPPPDPLYDPTCSSDGVINLDDVMKIMDAFAGNDPCGCLGS